MTFVQETRTAQIGIYSDRMVLSIHQENQQGHPFCLYRKEIEEDFLDQYGQADQEKLLCEAKKLLDFSRKMMCTQASCLGYGMLRYQPDSLSRELEAGLGVPVRVIPGSRQAQAAREGMKKLVQKQVEAGIYVSDLSTQFFGIDGQQGREQSFPLGWRTIADRYYGMVPNRLEQEQLKREIQEILSGSLSLPEADGGKIGVAGMDAMIRFLLLFSGTSEKNMQGVSLEREIFPELLRMMRNPSLKWLPLVEQVSERFPKKVFCQMLILETLMTHLRAKEAVLCKMYLEDHLYKEDRLVVK